MFKEIKEFFKPKKEERPNPASPDFESGWGYTNQSLDNIDEQEATARRGGNPEAWVDKKFLDNKADMLRETAERERRGSVRR